MDAALNTGALTVEDLLNFNFDEDGEPKDDQNTRKAPPSSTPCAEGGDNHQGLALPEFAEEELEWLSNKDAFPSVETCLDILSEKSSIAVSNHSPVSVLDITNNNRSSSGNGSMVTSCCGGRVLVPVQFPMKARSKRQRRTCFPDLPTRHFVLWGQENVVKQQQSVLAPGGLRPKAGSRCSHCQAEKTPQWRAGPMGPKTLCNACGVRFKSGRLVPEYRPANSPTFSSLLHSNSHRKVLEMRKQKLLEGMVVNEPCAYRVG